MSARRIKTIPHLPRRQRDAHKGNFGRVLVFGGSRGMLGAVALAANSALRGGAGLVTFAAPQSVQPFVATMAPCATSVPLPCGDDARLLPAAGGELRAAIDTCDVLAAGPGLDVYPQTEDLVRLVIAQTRPVVLDADGLNNLARIEGWPALRRCPLLLTPHPGEFSRLTGRGIGEIQAARQDAALQAVEEWTATASDDAGPLVLVLKGAGTVVADTERFYVNDTGNPGMASGGSGDVLTGLTAALLGQGLDLFDAGCLGVWAHGRAGDLAAGELGEASVTAADLLDHLPDALRAAVA